MESHQRRKERCSGSPRPCPRDIFRSVQMHGTFSLHLQPYVHSCTGIIGKEGQPGCDRPQVTSNVPKAWFLVLGCNRQDGKGGGWLETTQRLKQRRDEAGIWIASMLTVSSKMKEEEGDRCPMPRQDMDLRRLSIASVRSCLESVQRWFLTYQHLPLRWEVDAASRLNRLTPRNKTEGETGGAQGLHE